MATLFTLTSSSNFVFLKTIQTSKPQIANPSISLKKPLSIRCFQSPETTIPAKVQTFWGWLSDKGIISAKSPVKPGLVAEGLGLVAQKNMGRNEVVLEVPKKFWISPDTVAASEIGSVCNGLKPWVSVALFFMREKKLGNASSWKPYIDILPDCTDSTIYWYVFWVI